MTLRSRYHRWRCRRSGHCYVLQEGWRFYCCSRCGVSVSSRFDVKAGS